MSRAANGAARPAPMRSRAAPRRWSAGWPGRIRASSAYRCTRRGRCCALPDIPLAEWLFEAGIGEDRAILVEDGEIVEAAIELPSDLRAGAVVEARLAR